MMQPKTKFDAFYLNQTLFCSKLLKQSDDMFKTYLSKYKFMLSMFAQSHASNVI